ncbi:MAG: cytochrome c maturation protein CcmE, partial [Actinomycetia bacterium]|nr:cytochrome c maturation protein CcmE [Actinomycetes bacterium]
VDEAVELRDDLGDQNFRMQGTVISESGVDDVGALLFSIAFNDKMAEVRHVGDEPSSLFANGEKVIVEGHWDGEVFLSHQILVKHSEEYIEDNPERLDYELDIEAVE